MPYSEIKRYNLGVDEQFATAKQYADAIESFYSMPKEEYNSMCERVKEVSKRYDTEYLNRKFAEYCEIEID